MWNADESLAENETRWGKKEIIFPLLKVLLRVKRMLPSDFDLLKFREGAGVS